MFYYLLNKVEEPMDSSDRSFATVEDVFKYAIMVEVRGYEFFKSAADRTTNETARKFYQELADEENYHKQILTDLYRKWRDESTWDEEVLKVDRPQSFDIHDPILRQAFKKSLETTAFDTTALDIAIVLEQDAREFYRRALREVKDEELKRILEWLSQFEDDHYHTLVKIQESLREDYWYDNNFWPF